MSTLGLLCIRCMHWGGHPPLSVSPFINKGAGISYLLLCNKPVPNLVPYKTITILLFKICNLAGSVLLGHSCSW